MITPSYETLDTIADLYTPLLAATSLAFIAVALFKTQWRLAGLRFMSVTVALCIAYGLMLFDARFEIWPTFGLDYSTHTAVALALVTFLSVDKPKLVAIWYTSFIGYAILMLYQRYHTAADIAVTGAVVIGPVSLCLSYFYKRWPWRSSSTNHRSS